MSKYIYLSVIPEALIASMLPPKEFGDYMATGTKKRNVSQAIFFEIDLELIKDKIDMEYVNRRCVRKADGSPKSSVYLSTYRVLEMIPLKALKNLYVTTETGVVLELKKTSYDKSVEPKNHLHLYQELCPVSPRVATKYTPSEFVTSLTDGTSHVNVPRLFFADLKLGELATNPGSGSAELLPYRNVGHLRDCLEILKNDNDKAMKTVQRVFSGTLLYRTIGKGFYVGDKNEVVHYPFPSMAELEEQNYDFFRAI
ncbi:MAG TPA: hypothetical protein VMT63_01350 [Bacteroidales bacterium]|nr:hypothetical protein [Bacteroidales bacterium]